MRGAATLCLALCASACGTPNATFELDVPTAVASNAAWYEIGVFSNGCPSSALLLGGIPPQGPVARLAFAASAAAPPALGLLPKQTYGIAAVARAADCSVIATGCSALSVSGSGTLAVSLAAITGTASGACEPGAICDDAECLPSGDAAVPTSASCSLQLVGQGPLADPLNEQSTLLSAPAIAATPTGFLLAYREFDPTAGASRLTTIAIDPTGAAAAPVQSMLPGACTGNPQTDATGLAFVGDQGTIALSRPPCSDGGVGGVDLLTIDAAGNITQSSFSNKPNLEITLGTAHALASTPAGLLLAYTNQSTQVAFAATVAGGALVASPAPLSFSRLTGFTTETSAYVAGTDLGTGFLAIGPIAVEGDASTGSASMATEIPDAGSDASTRSSFTATWASASGVGSRILVASNGSGGPSSITWTAFTVGTTNPSPLSGTFGPASNGNVVFTDVAMRQDHAFFVAELGPGSPDISLFVFDKASTFPIQLTEVPFSSLPAIPIGMLRDGLVAVAASDTRVAVVWGTGKTLGSDDDVGGYAMFACSTADAPDASLSP